MGGWEAARNKDLVLGDARCRHQGTHMARRQPIDYSDVRCFNSTHASICGVILQPGTLAHSDRDTLALSIMC